MDKYLQGRCMEMCPRKERELRERERLLHPLETTRDSRRTRHPQADPNRTVKTFSRSAAGRAGPRADEIRPPEVLFDTVHYLLGREVLDSQVQHYDFIMDRLRAVRQDMVVQNAPPESWIRILEPIIRFHSYSAYRLCEKPLAEFDPSINMTHLQECLKRLLSLYDQIRTPQPQSASFEALYVVLNIGSEEALCRALALTKLRQASPVLSLAINLSLSWLRGNFVRCCRLISLLPPLLASVIAALHLPILRRRALFVMSHAYSSMASLVVPSRELSRSLLYGSDVGRLNQDCEYYGVVTTDDGLVFTKRGFQSEKKVLAPKHEGFIEDILNGVSLGELIFGESI